MNAIAPALPVTRRRLSPWQFWGRMLVLPYLLFGVVRMARHARPGRKFRDAGVNVAGAYLLAGDQVVDDPVSARDLGQIRKGQGMDGVWHCRSHQ